MSKKLGTVKTQFPLVLACAFTLALAALAQTGKMPGAESGFVSTRDGVKIHYLEAGQGPTILFVPGWTMPGWIWEKQIAHFAKTHRVVAMDPRSQGQSSQTTEGHYPAARARDIKAVVDQLKLAPTVLVGWSMGVTEVAAYVDQFGTETISGLVLVDGVAGGDYDPNFTPKILQFAASFQKDRKKSTDEFVRSMYKKLQSDDYLQRVMLASLRTPTNSAVALIVGAFTTDNRPALAKIDKPTLIVVAVPSPWTPAYQDIQKRIAGSRLESFQDVGHAIFVDEADRFNALLDQFLKRPDNSRQQPR